jgi:4,5-DOPA dioxygenase extradiol
VVGHGPTLNEGFMGGLDPVTKTAPRRSTREGAPASTVIEAPRPRGAMTRAVRREGGKAVGTDFVASHEVARTPALFVAHGSPAAALDKDEYAQTLGRFAREFPKPRAIVVVSAHWEAHRPLRVTAGTRPSLIYDFGGFPDELYRLTYAAPGEPVLAAEIVQLLTDQGLSAELDHERGWDHGVWIPLRFLYPAADVPVVELALPKPRTPAQLLEMGEALSPLRERGVLIVGSGGLVHNLQRIQLGLKDAPVAAWARAFDDWARDRLAALDVEALASYRTRAPYADLAVPTPEHLDPVFVVLGSGRDGEKPVNVFEGFHHGSLSMRTFAIRS